jgi:predicted GIY-YIG superfamily endonuclease
MTFRTYADIKFNLKTEDIPKNNVIYCLTFPNNKKYIGKTTSQLKERIRCHIKDAFQDKEGKFAKSRAIRKYMTFNVDVLFESDDENLLNEKEIFYIDLHNSYGKDGYNMTAGGDGNKYIMSDETKKRISEALKGKPAHNKKKVYQYSLDDEYLNEFESITYAASIVSGSKAAPTKISECVNGKRKTAYGFIWKEIK